MVAGERLWSPRHDGVLRAFFNVCRITPLPSYPACGQAFSTLSLSRLETMARWILRDAEFEGVENFDRAQNGLVPIRVEPGVLVFATGQSCSSLTEFLGAS